MEPLVIRTTPKGLAFMVREWLPKGMLYLRTDKTAELGMERRVELLLPDGGSVVLVGEVDEVSLDERGFRIGLRLTSENADALAILHEVAALHAPESSYVPQTGRSRDIRTPFVLPQSAMVGARRGEGQGATVSPQAAAWQTAPELPDFAASEPRLAVGHSPQPDNLPAQNTPRTRPPSSLPPPPPAQGARQGDARQTHSGLIDQAKVLSEQLKDGFEEINSMLGMTDERRRSLLFRCAMDLIRPVQNPDVLAELLLRALSEIVRHPPDRAWLHDSLLQMLPQKSLIAACTVLARQGHMMSAVGGREAEARLEVAARVVAGALALYLKKLDPDMVELLQALCDHGMAMSRRLPFDAREWIAAARYIRTTRLDAEAAVTALDSVRTQDVYKVEITAIEKAAELLRQERRWEALGPLVEVLVRHRDGPPGVFDERRLLAAAVLERFFGGSAVLDLVHAFSEADRDGRAELGRVLNTAGDRAARHIVEVLKRSSDVGVRRASIVLLRAQSDLARGAVIEALSDPKTEWLVLCNLITLLGDIGTPADQATILRFKDHQREQVRRAALEALVPLVGRSAEGTLVRALDDKSRIVQCCALLLLGKIRSTSPATLGYIHDLLKDAEAPDEDEDLACAAIEALAQVGATPMPQGGTSEEALVKTLERTRRGGLSKMFRGTAGGFWSRPTVRKVLCSALGRVGRERAEEVLRKVAYDDADPNHKDAEQAIFQIAERRKG